MSNKERFAIGQRVRVWGFDFLHIMCARFLINDRFDRYYYGTVYNVDGYDLEKWGVEPRIGIEFDDGIGPLRFYVWDVKHV